MMEIEVGSRVRVKKSEADHFTQPWRSRFESGREGTVVQGPSANVRGWLVEWDHKKVKYPMEWRMVMRSSDLIVLSDAP